MRNVNTETNETTTVEKARFYLTDEECKSYQLGYILHRQHRFYLTDEECKLIGI